MCRGRGSSIADQWLPNIDASYTLTRLLFLTMLAIVITIALSAGLDIASALVIKAPSKVYVYTRADITIDDVHGTTVVFIARNGDELPIATITEPTTVSVLAAVPGSLKIVAKNLVTGETVSRTIIVIAKARIELQILEKISDRVVLVETCLKDIRTGLPLAGVPLSISINGSLIPIGFTEADGCVRHAIPLIGISEKQNNIVIIEALVASPFVDTVNRARIVVSPKMLKGIRLASPTSFIDIEREIANLSTIVTSLSRNISVVIEKLGEIENMYRNVTSMYRAEIAKINSSIRNTLRYLEGMNKTITQLEARVAKDLERYIRGEIGTQINRTVKAIAKEINTLVLGSNIAAQKQLARQEAAIKLDALVKLLAGIGIAAMGLAILETVAGIRAGKRH